MNSNIILFKENTRKILAFSFLILSFFKNNQAMDSRLFDSDDETEASGCQAAAASGAQHGQLVNAAANTQMQKYTSLSWWLNVLADIKNRTANDAWLDYTSIVNESLTQNGYSSSDDTYDNAQDMTYEKLAEFGLATFKKTFEVKLNEFEQAQKAYFKGLGTQEQEQCLEDYQNAENKFGAILQKKNLPANSDYKIIQIGDLHGDLVSLLTLLQTHEADIDDDFSFKNKNLYFVFTGDYIDRGTFGLEILYIVMSLKIQNPDNVFVLLGNHESEHGQLAQYKFSFYNEVSVKFNSEYSTFMRTLQVKMLKYMPSGLLWETEFGRILFCHGLPHIDAGLPNTFLLSSKKFTFYSLERASTYFTLSDLSVLPPQLIILDEGDLRMPQSLICLNSYMRKYEICTCFRGHQHNASIKHINQTADQNKGMIAKIDRIFTTSSCNLACECPDFTGIGDCCQFCSITKQNEELRVDGISIDRLTNDIVARNLLTLQK